ncbi:MAG: SpoVR family protein [Lentisphaeria bacterium]|nr:SpoVR family protein [Lentisphaeria bacterium]NQZ66756.1 SpoVR family protein [Lentisphaeria bacterium]
MRPISTDKGLAFLEERVLHYANVYERQLPEMRFFILDENEFASLLSKHVYPTSPVNIWEGKEMVGRRLRVESGQETSLYYEVVQTGRPSYGYLNETNSAMMQASVMAHVVGHCEFSELNVMHDSNDDRTEQVMHLVRQIDMGRKQMGERNYKIFWNACESVSGLIHPNSQFNLENSIEYDSKVNAAKKAIPVESGPELYLPYSSTLDTLLEKKESESTMRVHEERRYEERMTLDRKGYKLYAPCQDILGFLREFAPNSNPEQSILEYMYAINKNRDFIMRTQIMNEGWAMYWEKKIMHDLFREKACPGIIEYAKSVSGVCFPRPWFQRNPYHLGYHMWEHIEELYEDGKVTLDYVEEIDLETKRTWHKPIDKTPMQCMEHLVESITDYEFLRRFLSPELITKFHLNRIHKRQAQQLGIRAEDVMKEDPYYIWLEPEPILDEMLNFFVHFHQPRIYLVDDDFMDGGLLLFHRNDGRKLRKDWIQPTLKNLNHIWKSSVSLVTDNILYVYQSGAIKESQISENTFEEICERMQSGEKALRL